MDERRFALHGGPTGCDSDEVECNRECMRGDARHCHVLGLGHRLRPINHELGTELLLRGCQLGLPESCVEWVLAVGRASDVDQCQRPVMECVRAGRGSRVRRCRGLRHRCRRTRRGA
ncbi:MAG: hypothetical protein IPI43_28130 [Sandaracinaceae bacterium]|nr:hypothetical protein [Sandaracinaceae bacterium]